MKQKKKKTSLWPFLCVFISVILLMLIVNLIGEDAVMLNVPNNTGAPLLETAGNSLVSVFQDGQACVWDWSQLQGSKKEFQLKTNRVVIPEEGIWAAINLKGPKQLSLMDWNTQKNLDQLDVGFEDQDVYPRISHDKSTLALVIKNKTDSTDRTVFEFASVDTDKEFIGLPASLSLQNDENLIEYAVSTDKIVYAVGRRAETGRIVAIDLQSRKILWDRVHADTKEFCHVAVAPDNQYLLAGNRNGILYKIDSKSGDVIKQIQLLEEGEKRPITNDYSVLNLAFSPDGKYYVATINPPAYILKAGSDRLVHKMTVADKLVSRIAFSPDSTMIATSDVRAGYPIKVWKLPTEN